MGNIVTLHFVNIINKKMLHPRGIFYPGWEKYKDKKIKCPHCERIHDIELEIECVCGCSFMVSRFTGEIIILKMKMKSWIYWIQCFRIFDFDRGNHKHKKKKYCK